MDDPNTREAALVRISGLIDDAELFAEAIVDTVAESILVLDGDLRVRFANWSFYKTFSVSVEDTVGKLIYQLGSGQWQIPALRKLLDEILPLDNHFEGLKVELSFPKIGHRIMALNARKLLRRETQQPLILLAIQDVTSETRSTDNLGASEERYRSLVDNLQDGIWTIDTSGNTLFANPGMAKLLGTTVEQMIGKPSFEYVFEEDAARARELFQKKMEGDSEPFESRIRRSDGSSFWALISGMPLYEPGGQTIGLLGTFHDITDRKLAEDVSARHSQELARSNAELRQFSYLISHDLREPIRTMRVYAQLLQGSYTGKLDRDADMFLDFIASGAERMDKLLNNLLSYSSVAARHEDTVEHVELKNALEWAIRNLDIAIKEARAEIQCDPLPTVLGNELQLVELFQNLLSNAIKYRQSGQPARVHIFAQLNSDDVIVAVRDHGIGIAKDHQAQIFLPFKRLHGLEIPGTGMGLAICNKIVQNHGGRIWVESEPGQGSTFFFTLRHSSRQDRTE